MMRSFALLLALVLALATPNSASAMRGGGGGGGGYSRPSGGGGYSHPSSASGGGYNFKSDYSGASRPSGSSSYHPSGGNSSYNRNGNTNYNRGGNTNYNRNTNISGNTINRNVVVNPAYSGGAWGWNHGVAWYPSPAYWGGGFWGAMAIGVTSAAVFGTIVNSTNNVTYTSYQVQSSSPGATLLSNYQLTQVQCGPPNLVVIYGPNNSVICARPNQLVAAGQYNLDTATMSLSNA
jgi:hypothetical protein